MKITPAVRGFAVAGAFCALVLAARAQIVELRGTINAAQENNPTNTSPATGTAIMLYNVVTNTFDLVISITGMTNPATASHIHEAPAGSNGPVVTNLGAEAVYTRSGGNLTATFTNVRHLGSPLTLIQGGAYFNIHSAQYPGGEVRGQLTARPVRLVANLDLAQEQAAMPNVTFTGVNNFGGAIMIYDPATNRFNLRTSLFNYTQNFTNSHIHEGGPGISGPVRTALGTNPNADAYSNVNGYIAGTHDNVQFVGDVMGLLSGNMYLNYHSTQFGGGQLRGQLGISNEIPSARLANLSVRGFVGTGDQVLIAGVNVSGTEPVRVLITAKGSSLTALGVAGALADPRLALHDSAGRQIALNDNVGPLASNSELAAIPFAPRGAGESALLVVLPPGNYTAIVSAATGTGVALLEVYDLRSLSGSVPTAVVQAPPAAPSRAAKLAATAQAAIELCATPITVATIKR